MDEDVRGSAGGFKDSGQKRLEEMGYKQELKRDLTLFTNFFLSMTGLSAITGIMPLYSLGLTFGGPMSFIYAWPPAALMNIFVSLSMAEICSAFPTAGGLYYWSYSLAGPKWGPFASWITGWFNLIGQIMGNCSVNFTLALLTQTIILLSTGGGNGGGYYASKYVVVGIHAGAIFFEGLINILAVRWLGTIVTVGAVWTFFGSIVQTFVIPSVAVHKASASFVFTTFNKENGLGIHSYPYIVVVSLLLVQYSILGYDASAHMSEETQRSDRGSAYGMVASVVLCAILGYAYLLAVTFAVTDPAHLLDPENDAKGYAMAQLYYDVFRDRYGSGTGGIICLCITAVDFLFVGICVLAINSRLLYAFSRDGAVPFSRLWRILDRNNVPVPAVWLSAFFAFVAALTYLGSEVAFQATLSIATIALYIAYGLPILFRLTLGRKTFVPGPFNLGRFSMFVGTISVLWVAALTVIFCLPVAYPVTTQTLNYTPVLIGGVTILVLGGWFTYARFWFNGPYSRKEGSGVHL